MSDCRCLRALIAILVVFDSLVFVGSAFAAETAEPGFEISSSAYPTVMKPGGKGIVIVQVFNTGAGSTGGTVTMTDTLPPGLEATPGAGAMTNFRRQSTEKKKKASKNLKC